MPADPPTALKGELGVAMRVAWSRPIPLDDVKAIGHATGTTVNDVLLTAVAGALRSYLDGRDTHVEELTAVVPFNLRPLDQPLPSDLGNRFGLVYLPLPVGTRGLPRSARRGAPPHGADQAFPGGRGLLRGARRDRPDARADRKASGRPVRHQGQRGDDQRAGAAPACLPGGDAGARRPRAGCPPPAASR